MVTGRISFIGAGPGAADLITVRAARRIAEADVVLWSASLVTPECVKEHARADAELVDSAQLSHEQALEIYRRAERDRLNVVRVHSGDPALWSAVQDQHDACLRMNVEVEIVPGVAPVAAAAAAVGRELTAPDGAQSLVVTRFENGRTPVPDGESVREFARHGTTMAVFTSAARAGRLVEELRSGGYSEDTPVLVAYKVSWPDELLLRTTVGELERTVKQHKLWRNTLFLVGKVLGGGRTRGSFPRRSDARPARTRRHGYGSASRFAPDEPEPANGRFRESDVAWWAVRDWQQTARAAVRVAAGRAAARAGEDDQPELFSPGVEADPAPVVAPPEPEPEAAAPAEPAAAQPAPAEPEVAAEPEQPAAAASAKRTSAASTTTSRATAKTTAKSSTRSRSKTTKSGTSKSKAQSGAAKPRRKSTTSKQGEAD